MWIINVQVIKYPWVTEKFCFQIWLQSKYIRNNKNSHVTNHVYQCYYPENVSLEIGTSNNLVEYILTFWMSCGTKWLRFRKIRFPCPNSWPRWVSNPATTLPEPLRNPYFMLLVPHWQRATLVYNKSANWNATFQQRLGRWMGQSGAVGFEQARSY